MSQNPDCSQVEPISYRNDLINAKIGQLRLNTEAVAQLVTDARLKASPAARPMAPKTVAAIRDGDSNIRLQTLKEVLDAIGMTLPSVFQPLEESEKAAA